MFDEFQWTETSQVAGGRLKHEHWRDTGGNVDVSMGVPHYVMWYK